MTRLVRLPLITAASSVLFLLQTGPLPALNPSHDGCGICHSVHGAVGPALLKDLIAETLCLSCHGPGGTAVTVDIHRTDTGGDFTCVECHDPHNNLPNALGGVNLKLVLPAILTPTSGTKPVAFESRGTDAGGPSLHSFADNDEDANGTYDGVCEVCHTATSYHRNNSSGIHSHETGRTCTLCHPHADSFQPTAGSCLLCHVSPQDNGDNVPPGGRRAVVDEFGYASHHVAGSVTDADCLACHEQSQHQQGTVRLTNADDGAIIYTPSDANIADFCISCHDADGSTVRGGIPFSDGQWPPIVSDTLWASASHNALGSLVCLDCHDSGHGSRKRKLLAPFDVAPTAPANAEEEEGFCLVCHDADGPASSDIAAQFDPAVRWVTNVVGANVNLNLNDRHDVQYSAQSVSGAKIECTHCHNPHADTISQRVRSDPDPGDGRTPGSGYLTGSDFMTDWCLDCHDGSFPSSVTGPTTALANILSTHQVDSHGTAGGNASLKSGYGWVADDVLPCLACHTPHPGAKHNLFQTKDTVYSKDGVTPIPSDGAGLDYFLTDNNVRTPAVNGYEWCNTCHTSSMGDKKSNCFDCHYHGSGRF